jgi:hypothetical protein
MSWEAGHQKLHNKFRGINEEILNTKGFIDERKSKILLYKFLKENPSFTSEFMTGVSLFPFQHMAIKAMMDSDYFLGIWCLDENEYVLTESGFKKIKDVNVGERVRSRNKLNLVTDKKFNAPNEKGLYIKTFSGDSFKAKLGHKTLIYNSLTLDLEFKEIETLSTEDFLPIKLGMNCWGDAQLVENSPKMNIEDCDYWYFLLGYMIGDGYFDDYTMHWCSEDSKVIDMTIAKAKEYFPKNKIICRSRADNGFLEMGISSKDLIDWLKSIGFDRSLKAKNKIIPDSILQINEQKMAALISGIFSADGYCSILKDKRYSNSKTVKLGLKNTSIELLRQVKMLLNNFGVESSIRYSGSHKDVPYYDLKIPKSGHQKFSDRIGFISDHKQDNLLEVLNLPSRKYQINLVPNLGTYLKKKYKTWQKLFGERGNFGKDMCLDSALSAKFLDEKDRQALLVLKNENIYFSKIETITSIETSTVDITVDSEENYVGNGIVHHNSRGMSKSFSTAVFAILDATLNQGVHIGIISKSFRQSKMIFRKIEEISRSPKAGFLAQCITRISKTNDEWIIEIGRSRITALPLGDGEKLRGFRFQRMIIDELLLMPEKILNEVILPFLSVVENPTERQQLHDLESKLIAKGEMIEEDRYRWPSNKIIGLSSASYKFEYLYKLYQEYERLIMHPDRQDGAHRVIMHFSYDCAPQQLYDQNLLSQAKATMSQSQFEREFGSVFTDDSSGYFKVSKMALCTVVDGEGQSVVHSYAMAGTNLKKHIEYFHYLLSNFNIIAVVGDYNGGVQFLSACNESEVFKRDGLKLDTFDFDFDNIADYDKSLREARSQYNLTTKRIVHLRKPSSFWIRYANELLQGSFDHRRIWFAGMAIDDDYSRQKTAKISIDDIKYSKIEEDLSSGAKLIDFIEHQKDMIELIKVQCALVQVTTSTQGTQSFDLPSNLKKQKGANRARKDSYSALVLGNWMMHMYYDMMAVEAAAAPIGFTPMFIC